MTIVAERNDDCSQCGGTGQLKQLTQQGETLFFECPRCHGLKRDRGFTYR
jgi:DnaJ-class molecular chaperone